MTKALWRLQAVGVEGAGRDRLREINVEVGPGVTAVLGPSGAGKTTLLNLLVEFEVPGTGAVSCSVARGEHVLSVYWVPQTGGLWPHLKVRQHLERVLPGRDEAARVAAMLAAFDLVDKLESYPDELSLGERARLAVARALLADAAVLVMDEPLAHVDTTQQARYWRVIRGHLAERGTSLVFATHSPRTVLAEAQHVICLRGGWLLYSGEVGQLYRQPQTRELAECLGEANWLEPEELRLWLGLETVRPVCIRPEQVSITDSADGPIMVRESRFQGGVAEVELEHEPTGATRRMFHRPAGDLLRAGQRVVLKLLCLLMLLMLVGCGDSEPGLAVREIHTWAMPPDGRVVPAPRSVAIGPDDQVVVLDDRGRVLIFDATGSLQRQWRMIETKVGRPEGVCVLSDGTIVVCDTHYYRVVFFDQKGNVTGQLGSQGTGPGQFLYPVGIVQDDQDNLYVCEYGGNDRVQKFTRQGKFLATFGSFGTGPGQFQRPSGMVWHAGRVYVADAVNNRIEVFSDDGRFLQEWAGLSLQFPYDLALGADDSLYVVEYGAGRVSRVGLQGQLLGRFGSNGEGLGQLRTPWGLAIDSKLRLRIADTGNRRIVEMKL